MNPIEAFNAATINGAHAMELEKQLGSIQHGKKANLIITKNIPSINFIPYCIGRNIVNKIIINGDWIFGNGSNLSTKELEPLKYLDFEMNRKNLASHSLILECIYRVGLVGLILFFLFILSFWNFMWNSRESNLTRIVCSTVIMLA